MATKAKEYRARAIACQVLAKKVAYPSARQGYLETAREWRELAELAQIIAPLSSTATADRQITAVKVPLWSVIFVGSRSQHLGAVEASSERAAIEKGAETFQIPPEYRNRIAVLKLRGNTKKPPSDGRRSSRRIDWASLPPR